MGCIGWGLEAAETMRGCLCSESRPAWGLEMQLAWTLVVSATALLGSHIVGLIPQRRWTWNGLRRVWERLTPRSARSLAAMAAPTEVVQAFLGAEKAPHAAASWPHPPHCFVYDIEFCFKRHFFHFVDYLGCSPHAADAVFKASGSFAMQGPEQTLLRNTSVPRCGPCDGPRCPGPRHDESLLRSNP